jgi:hypothetical protein
MVPICNTKFLVISPRVGVDQENAIKVAKGCSGGRMRHYVGTVLRAKLRTFGKMAGDRASGLQAFLAEAQATFPGQITAGAGAHATYANS